MPAFATPPTPPVAAPVAQVACASAPDAPAPPPAPDDIGDDHVDLRTSYLGTRGPLGGASDGGYLSGEAFSIPWDDGYGVATDTGFGVGWSSGLAYELRAGVGLGLRSGPLVAAVLVGGGLDGFGAFGPAAGGDHAVIDTAMSGTPAGAPLHVPFDAYTYLAGHVRYTTGELRLDVSVAQTSGTAADERRYAARLSYDKPFDRTGLGVDLERIDVGDLHGGGRGSVAMVGLSYSSSIEAPPRR
jgi:hypothetical protein|nr:hypothetical protein [Kofleriaceae bacterium]